MRNGCYWFNNNIDHFYHKLLSALPIPTLFTAALVVELLEYCDEYEEESQEEGSSDNEMEEGGATMAEEREERSVN